MHQRLYEKRVLLVDSFACITLSVKQRSGLSRPNQHATSYLNLNYNSSVHRFYSNEKKYLSLAMKFEIT